MDSMTNAQKAEVLNSALPYIQKYYNKTVVVKYGGNAMINEDLKKAVMRDVVLLSLIGVRVVLVHGGGPEITEMLSKINKKTEFIDGLRVTDKETAEIVQMVLAGKINKNLVGLIQNLGGKAIGLSGIDGHMIKAKKLDERLGFVGEITKSTRSRSSTCWTKGISRLFRRSAMTTRTTFTISTPIPPPRASPRRSKPRA